MASLTSEFLKKIKVFQITDFEKIKEVDSGGHGSVSLYSNKQTGETVAVKTLLRRSEEIFIREIAPLRELVHENIVKFYGRTQISEFNALVMEFMEGGNLRDAIHNSPNSNTLHEILSWNLQSANALEFMHSRKVSGDINSIRHIHRDIKPENMLLDITRQTLKICDFGLAKKFESTGKGTSNVGTLTYVAPEVIQGKPYNEKCDVYSWALTFWECLSGKTPFSDCHTNGEKIGIALIKLKDYRLPYVETVSEKLNRIIQSCSNPNPKKRLSMSSMKILLENMLDNCKNKQNIREGFSQNSVGLFNPNEGKLYECEGLIFDHWETFDENPLQIEEPINQLEDIRRNSDNCVWSINKDFDINYCEDLNKGEWQNSYTSFFQLSLFEKQFRFRPCVSNKKRIYFFTTNKELQFEEFHSFDTDSDVMNKHDRLKNPQDSLTYATFRNMEKDFMLLTNEARDLQGSFKCQLYDFKNDIWIPDVCELPKNNMRYVQFVTCRNSVMAFFMDESKNEAYQYNKNSKVWIQLSPPANQFKYPKTSLTNHNGCVYVNDGIKLEKYVPKDKLWNVIDPPKNTSNNPIKLISFKNKLFAFIDNVNGHEVQMLNEVNNQWVVTTSVVPDFSGIDLVVV